MSASENCEIEGLPEGARVQKIREVEYAFFNYCFRAADGKIKQERDYIGTVENKKFVPNYFYLTCHPVRQHRDPRRWKDPERRARTEAEAQEEQKLREEAEAKQRAEREKYHDFSLPVDGGRCVGLTAVAIALLYRTRIIEDIFRYVLNSIDDVIHVVNLGVFSAVTAKPTYLAAAESGIQQFIGKGCLSSPRASEFFERIGKNLDLSTKITEARISHLKSGALLALDGTRIDCNSEQIGMAAVGKKKDGTFDSQINFSMLVNASEGYPLGYRVFAGNVNDMATMSDFRAIWNDCGLKGTDASIVMDRGYFAEAELLRLNQDGYKFLVGAKTNSSRIHKVITDRNCDFYEASGLIRHRGCYGVKEVYEAKRDGVSAKFTSYTFRNPSRECEESDSFMDALDLVEKHWLEDKMTSEDKRLLGYFKNPKPGKPLLRDQTLVNEDSHLFGFFSMVGNVDEPLEKVLDKYEQRNEVEVLFKLMFGHLLQTTRVQSTQALEALLFVVFIGITLLTSLRAIMLKTDVPSDLAVRRKDTPSKLSELFTISEIFSELQHIMMSRDANGTLRLLNVSKKDRVLVRLLGLEGLFDDPENVAKLLSPTYMKEQLEAAVATAVGTADGGVTTGTATGTAATTVSDATAPTAANASIAAADGGTTAAASPPGVAVSDTSGPLAPATTGGSRPTTKELVT